jgi:hypothetical protein
LSVAVGSGYDSTARPELSAVTEIGGTSWNTGGVVSVAYAVTVIENVAIGVELPRESCARQPTLCDPTVNREPELAPHTKLYGGEPPLAVKEKFTCAQ